MRKAHFKVGIRFKSWGPDFLLVPNGTDQNEVPKLLIMTYLKPHQDKGQLKFNTLMPLYNSYFQLIETFKITSSKQN